MSALVVDEAVTTRSSSIQSSPTRPRWRHVPQTRGPIARPHHPVAPGGRPVIATAPLVRVRTPAPSVVAQPGLQLTRRGLAVVMGVFLGMVAAATRVATVAESLYEMVRGMLRRLRPANLDELGLVAALQELCESWEERSGVPCVFHSDGALDGLGDAANITLYRVTQEALSNVMRHARAAKVRIGLAALADGRVQLTVQDDGIGMEVAASHRGLGLLGAAERVAALGGQFDIDGRPGAGTRLTIRLAGNPRLAVATAPGDNPPRK